MQDMGSVRLSSNIPSLEDGVSIGSESLSKGIQNFCWEKRDRRKLEWETQRVALERMKESKEKQNLERTRAAMRNSISKASTILDKERRLTITEDDFLVIQQKMSYNKIDQRLTDLYRNWQAEYKDAIASEECEEIRRFYKPYLEKYESKYRILYQMLQQADRPIRQTSLLPTKSLPQKSLLV